MGARNLQEARDLFEEAQKTIPLMPRYIRA